MADDGNGGAARVSQASMARDILGYTLWIAGVALGSVAVLDWLGYTIFVAQAGLP